MQTSRLERAGRHRELVVLLHAFCQSPKAIKPVKDAVRDAYPDADIYAPKLPFGGPLGWLCTRDATEVVAEVIGHIEEIVALRSRDSQQDGGQEDSGEYESIVLVGHSMGAVMARKIAIVAHGEQDRSDCPTLTAPFEPAFSAFVKPRSWASKISRIVLIAGMNRGWTPSSAMDWWTSTKWNIFISVGETLFAGSPIIFDIRQGAVFSIQTRLQWLALMHCEPGSTRARPDIVVTQLLGTVDDIVSPDDSVDYAVDGSGHQRSYFYLEVPNSGHSDIVRLKRPEHVAAAMRRNDFVTARRPGQSAKAFARICDEQRYVVFRRALENSPADLAADRCTVDREQMVDSLPNPPNWNVTDVVFVIHGIRDKGFWTQKIARAIKLEAAGRKQDFRSVTTSYGYFAMAPFVLWWVRKQKAEWLMDQYAEARAHYPRAHFSYVGHSNGTYLVARALRDYPAAQFKRIALAGSVVRTDYHWHELGARVQQVVNYVATGDWVVAIFPKGMQPIRLLDLGSAGHDGFREAGRGLVHQVDFIAGSHGAGHEERHWSDIARFIVSGTVPAGDAKAQSGFIKLAGFCSTILLAGGAALILWLGFLIAFPALCQIPHERLLGLLEWINLHPKASCAPDVSPGTAAFRTFAAILYLWAVYIVISRV
jgi:pimeloyl-ACP methyl ester carboxylesterase